MKCLELYADPTAYKEALDSAERSVKIYLAGRLKVGPGMIVCPECQGYLGRDVPFGISDSGVGESFNMGTRFVKCKRCEGKGVVTDANESADEPVVVNR